MNAIVGVDVSKGESNAQAFIDKNQPYGKCFCFKHTKEGLNSFLKTLQELERVSGVSPGVILEATGHYHFPIVQALEKDYVLYVINPLSSYRAKAAQLRKVKTDPVDAFQLGLYYYKEEPIPYKRQNIHHHLRALCRQHESITGIYTEIKNQFHATLDQVFPQYAGVFGRLFSEISLNLLSKYPTPQAILAAGLQSIRKEIDPKKARRSMEWADGKANEIMVAAQNSPLTDVCAGRISNLNRWIQSVAHYQKMLSELEKEINNVASQLSEYNLLLSIPGIGKKIAATLLSEIGEIGLFKKPKHLVAFAGMDPSVYSSGKFKATSNKITKRGSKRIRHAVYLAVQCGLRGSSQNSIRSFYEKKRAEGKAHKVAIVACANKLLRCIHAILTNKEIFVIG